MPALQHSTSSRPWRSRAAATSRSADAGFARSVSRYEAWPPPALISATAASAASRSRATTMTRAPAAAKTRAMPRPIPRLPPVTTTERPLIGVNMATSPRGHGSERVAAALGLRVVRSCTGGEFGAVLVEDAPGRCAILKVMPEVPPWSGGWADSVGLAERLRVTGYPAPRYLRTGSVAGHLYTLQEVMPGAVPEWLTAGHMCQVLALAERHAGMAGASPGVWPSY